MNKLYKIKFCNGDEKFIKIFNKAKNMDIDNLIDMITNSKDVKYVSYFIKNKEHIIVENIFR